ncbi:OmpA family protein, partial [Rhizobium leguminosarum]|nr:OmpA family protein [Rhizobium leguminosarum]
MSAPTGYVRRLAAAAMLLALAACSTTDIASVEEPAAAPMTGQTNDPAPGFENVAMGSEE